MALLVIGHLIMQDSPVIGELCIMLLVIDGLVMQ